MAVHRSDCKAYAQYGCFQYRIWKQTRAKNDQIKCQPFQENHYTRWDGKAEEVTPWSGKHPQRIKLETFRKPMNSLHKV